MLKTFLFIKLAETARKNAVQEENRVFVVIAHVDQSCLSVQSTSQKPASVSIISTAAVMFTHGEQQPIIRVSAGSASVINCCRGHARAHTHEHTHARAHARTHAHTDRCAGWKAAEEETNEGNTRETKLTSLNKQTRRVLQREVMKRQSTSDQRRRGRARPREQTSTGSHSTESQGRVFRV